MYWSCAFFSCPKPHYHACGGKHLHLGGGCDCPVDDDDPYHWHGTSLDLGGCHRGDHRDHAARHVCRMLLVEEPTREVQQEVRGREIVLEAGTARLAREDLRMAGHMRRSHDVSHHYRKLLAQVRPHFGHLEGRLGHSHSRLARESSRTDFEHEGRDRPTVGERCMVGVRHKAGRRLAAVAAVVHNLVGGEAAGGAEDAAGVAGAAGARKSGGRSSDGSW